MFAAPQLGAHLPDAPPGPTDRDDVVLAEAQLIVVMSLKVQQGLSAAPVTAQTGHVVLVVPLVTLHAVVWGQLLPEPTGKPQEKSLSTAVSAPQNGVEKGPEAETHHATVFGVRALEVACHTQDGFPEVCHQLRLLDVLGLQCFQVVLPWGGPENDGTRAPPRIDWGV